MAALSNDKLKESDRRRVAAFVQSHAGIQLPSSKHSLIESRLRKRQRACKLNSLADYIDFALNQRQGIAERVHLLDAITTNKTDFFREPVHFDFLHSYITQSMDAGVSWTKASPFRAWSAGCSTGEEPYTLAMVLKEIQQLYPVFDFKINATDISISCLSTARKATYRHHQIDPVPMALRKRYLLRSRNKDVDLVKIGAEIRAHIDFSEYNLLAETVENRNYYDIIFCRNVMIYFDHNDRTRITSRFHQYLKPSGLLFIGHSEALTENHSRFQRIKPTIYRKL